MEPQKAHEVYNEIIAHIKNQGGEYSSWYAGIASDWETRLFKEHQVPREKHWWIALQCNNKQAAITVDDALIV